MPRLSPVVAVLLLAGVSTAAPPPPVTAAAYTPDGKRVAFGFAGEVRLFDPTSAAESGRYADLPGRVTAVAVDPTGTRLAVAAGEAGKSGVVRVVKLTELSAGKGQTLTGHTDAVYALAFSPDGKTLATAGYDRVIRLWDTETGQSVRELRDHSDAVYGLSFHPGGKLLASASADRAVKVWDAATGTRLYTLADPTDWVYAVAWSPDGKHLTAGGVDKSVRVWAADRAGGRLVRSAFAHEGPVVRLGYTGDGKTLYTAGEDRVIKAWDAGKLTETKVFPPQTDAILGLAVRPDGRQLGVSLFDGRGLLLDAPTGKPTAQPLPPKPVPPAVDRVTPAAVPRGSTTRVTLAGKGLDRLTKATSTDPAVVVKVVPGGVEVTVPPTTPAGVVKLTVESEAGKSAPVTLAIDRYAAVPEAGATDSARVGMAVRPNVTVAGAVDRAGDVDFFRFKADRGAQLGVQVVAAELGSKLDPVLVLTDDGGRLLAEGGAALGFVAPEPGVYAVGVRDREYRGGADFTYRLHLGDVPVITGVYPLGLSRGRSVNVFVQGVNLGPVADRPVLVSAPADAAPGSKVAVPVPIGAEKPLGKAEVVIDEYPPAYGSTAGVSEAPVPGTADGILLKPGDVQATKFPAKKGERLVIETNAQRLGSPIDPVIEVVDAAGRPVPRAVLRATAKTYSTFRDHDSAGPGIRLDTWNELAIDDYLFAGGELMKIVALPKNPDDDCQFYQVGGRRAGFLDTTPQHHAQGVPMYKVEVHPPGSTFPPNGLPTFGLDTRNDDGPTGYGKDSRLLFDPPSDGVYQVRVADARGAGGPGHAYRVTVRRPRPDFAVSVGPMTPGVWKGGGVPLTVTADRKDGYDGPIKVRLTGLPPGFDAPETTIEPGQTTTAFALFAAADAAVPAGTQPKLVARATIGGREVTHESPLGMPKLLDGGDLVTTTQQSAVTVKPGGETRLVVRIERKGDFTGRVPVEVRGLPHGVRVLDIGLNGILLTERDTAREIAIYAEPWVTPSSHPIAVVAKSERKGTDHAAKSVLLTVGR